jgi:hypothetical protein
MRVISGFAFGAMVLAAAAPAHAAANALIGKWVVVPGQETCSIVSHIFTATTETSTVRPIGPYPGETSTAPVRYNLEDPKAIYVIGPAGTTNAGRWQIVDANHIRDTSFSDCLYQRAK